MSTLKMITATALALGSWCVSDACSRVVYQGDDGDKPIVMVGRTLDWRNPIPTNIYVYPRGVEKVSMPQEPCLSWRSKYGSVIAVGYDGGVTEGMNEAGLAMNGLFCKGTIYTVSSKDSDMPVMSLAMIVSYFLDNFQNVEEADAWVKANPFGINGQTFDGGTVSTLHWALTDTTGETLVLEYKDGVLNTYRGKEYTVLTNDPPMPQMLAIDQYWQGIGGQNMLPGTVRSSDRFVRASYFISHVPKNLAHAEALGCLESIMGLVSVPLGYEIEGEPNLSSTQWRSVSDLTDGYYYFKFADSTGDFWIDLGRLSLNPGAPILMLDTEKNHDIVGCANGALKKTEGFTPMY